LVWRGLRTDPLKGGPYLTGKKPVRTPFRVPGGIAERRSFIHAVQPKPCWGLLGNSTPASLFLRAMGVPRYEVMGGGELNFAFQKGGRNGA